MCDYIKPAVLENLDSNQYGTVPKSSTTLALLVIRNTWTKGIDGNSAIIIAVLFDHCKAFDLIDHDILNCVLLNVPMK